MTEELNKIIARRLVEEGLGEGKLTEVERLVAPDVVDHAPLLGEPPGVEGTKEVIRTMRRAFPDLYVDVADLVADGDRVVARWKGYGTHRGEFLGVAPTGKRVTFTGMTEARVKDGRITDLWETWDAPAILRQVGAIRAPAESALPASRRGEPKE